MSPETSKQSKGFTTSHANSYFFTHQSLLPSSKTARSCSRGTWCRTRVVKSHGISMEDFSFFKVAWNPPKSCGFLRSYFNLCSLNFAGKIRNLFLNFFLSEMYLCKEIVRPSFCRCASCTAFRMP